MSNLPNMVAEQRILRQHRSGSTELPAQPPVLSSPIRARAARRSALQPVLLALEAAAWSSSSSAPRLDGDRHRLGHSRSSTTKTWLRVTARRPSSRSPRTNTT
jgi:hypothetical protein